MFIAIFGYNNFRLVSENCPEGFKVDAKDVVVRVVPDWGAEFHAFAFWNFQAVVKSEENSGAEFGAVKLDGFLWIVWFQVVVQVVDQ